MSDTKRIDFPLPTPESGLTFFGGTCKSCGADLVFIETPAHKYQPLSAASKEVRDGRAYYISHFADCPNADRFRKPKADDTIDRGNYG